MLIHMPSSDISCNSLSCILVPGRDSSLGVDNEEDFVDLELLEGTN